MRTKIQRLSVEPDSPDSATPPEVALEVLGALQEIRFGSVEVTVHNGRVVQIERREKIRLAGDERVKA